MRDSLHLRASWQQDSARNPSVNTGPTHAIRKRLLNQWQIDRVVQAATIALLVGSGSQALASSRSTHRLWVARLQNPSVPFAFSPVIPEPRHAGQRQRSRRFISDLSARLPRQLPRLAIIRSPLPGSWMIPRAALFRHPLESTESKPISAAR